MSSLIKYIGINEAKAITIIAIIIIAVFTAVLFSGL